MRITQDVDELTGRLADRMEDLKDRAIDAVSDQVPWFDPAPRRRLRARWPERLLWLALGMMMGAATAFLADPERGRSRRARLYDQAAARGRSFADDAAQQGRYLAGQAKGAAIEAGKELLPDQVPDDPRVLVQRIRSDVFGYRDDVADVVITVDGPGEVALTGTVPSEDSVPDLVAAVEDVEGVVDVRSELVVRSS